MNQYLFIYSIIYYCFIFLFSIVVIVESCPPPAHCHAGKSGRWVPNENPWSTTVCITVEHIHCRAFRSGGVAKSIIPMTGTKKGQCCNGAQNVLAWELCCSAAGLKWLPWVQKVLRCRYVHKQQNMRAVVFICRGMREGGLIGCAGFDCSCCSEAYPHASSTI